MGYPLVKVEILNSTTFEIFQWRYKQNPDALELDKYQSPSYEWKWDIPVWYHVSDEPVKLRWLTRKSTLFISADTAHATIVLNAGRRCFYRQTYDEEGWKKISRQLKNNHKIYSSRTRSGIISDAFVAASKGFIDYITVLDLLQYLGNEKDYLPWKVALNGLFEVQTFFYNDQDLNLIKRYMRNLLKPVYEEKLFQDVSEHYKNDAFFFESNLKIDIIGSYCAADAEECIDKYARLFEKEVILKCGKGSRASECVRIAAPLRFGAYCYGIKKYGKTAYEKVMDFYKHESVHVEQSNLLRALGCSNSKAVLKGILEMALEQKVIRLQDIPSAFYAVAKSPLASDFMFRFLFDNWERIYASLQSSDNLLRSVISACLSKAHTEVQLEEVKEFVEKHEVAAAVSQFRKEMELIEFRIKWIANHLESLRTYFRTQQ